MQTTEVITKLAQLRAKRGLGATQLAAKAGVSRQTIYAIEAGTYVPNTVVSLKLARVLETTVEDLFTLEASREAVSEIAEVCILGETESLPLGQPLRLASVNDRIVAVAADLASGELQPTDAVLLASIRGKGDVNAKVRLLGDAWRSPERILLAGSDPSASLLAHTLERQGYQLVVAYENRSSSLQLLREGMVHIAGRHLSESIGNKTDLSPITKLFPRNSLAVFCFAIWKEGLVVAQGNPKKVEGIQDLVRKDIAITNREAGAGCRRLLDELLKKHGIDNCKVKGYDRITVGQLPAAGLVYSGKIDGCISTQAAALTMGLTFLPLAEKPYLLVVRKAHLELAPMQALLEVLGRSSFRREVEACTGYDMSTAGNRLI